MADLPDVRRLIERGIESGQHPGAAVCVLVDGEPVAELAIGESRPGVPMNHESLLLWMSSSKPLGAAAIQQLLERGKLALDDPVARHLPEFSAEGKQNVTIRHLLTHTGGFRWVDLRGAEFDWDEIIRRICAAPLEADWIPGEKGGYHPYTSWYILGELVHRVDGRPFGCYVREEIFLPLSMRDSWIGMPLDQHRNYGDRIALTYETERPSRPVHRYSSSPGAIICVPGGNGYGPVRELARFYEMLRRGGELGGTRVLSVESVDRLTHRERIGMYDSTFRHVIDFSLGLIVNSARYGADVVPYGYGAYASDATFGHSGSQSSAAFCDPANRLVAVVAFTGMPGEIRHQRRIRLVLDALYEDLGMANR